MKHAVAVAWVLVLLVGACAKRDSRSEAAGSGAHGSAGSTVPPPPAIDAAPADPAMTPVPRPVPPGPYVVAYDCSHSNMPFGKGGWFRNMSIDLAKLTWTTLEVTTTGEEDSVAPPDRPPPPKPTVTAASPAVAQKIAAAVDHVLGGGPYKAEWPVSEGVPCTLTVTTAAGGAVYRIDKAYNVEKDAVNDLIALFTASVGK